MKISTAKRSLVVAVGFEEKFYLLLENYAEFEQALLELTLHRLIFSDSDWSSFQDNILTVNRRLANLLSAARLYLDQIDHELAKLFGSKSAIVLEVRTARKVAYDQRPGYRVMEALRNYLQHRNFPVHSLSFDGRREEIGGRVFAEHTIDPAVSVAELQRDGGLKAAVLKELIAKGSLVPVTPLVREYVEGLARVHASLRTSVAEQVAHWEETITAAIQRAKDECGDSSTRFLALAYGDDSDEEVVQLLPEQLARRQFLERMSQHATMLANHYVSGRTGRGDA